MCLCFCLLTTLPYDWLLKCYVRVRCGCASLFRFTILAGVNRTMRYMHKGCDDFVVVLT